MNIIKLIKKFTLLEKILFTLKIFLIFTINIQKIGAQKLVCKLNEFANANISLEKDAEKLSLINSESQFQFENIKTVKSFLYEDYRMHLIIIVLILSILVYLLYRMFDTLNEHQKFKEYIYNYSKRIEKLTVLSRILFTSNSFLIFIICYLELFIQRIMLFKIPENANLNVLLKEIVENLSSVECKPSQLHSNKLINNSVMTKTTQYSDYFNIECCIKTAVVVLILVGSLYGLYKIFGTDNGTANNREIETIHIEYELNEHQNSNKSTTTSEKISDTENFAPSLLYLEEGTIFNRDLDYVKLVENYDIMSSVLTSELLNLNLDVMTEQFKEFDENVKAVRKYRLDPDRHKKLLDHIFSFL